MRAVKTSMQPPVEAVIKFHWFCHRTCCKVSCTVTTSCICHQVSMILVELTMNPAGSLSRPCKTQSIIRFRVVTRMRTTSVTTAVTFIGRLVDIHMWASGNDNVHIHGSWCGKSAVCGCS